MIPIGIRQSAATSTSSTFSDICNHAGQLPPPPPQEPRKTHLLGHDACSVAHAHALNTSSDSDIDLAGSDLEGNVVDGGEAGRALAVESADGGRYGKSGCGRESRQRLLASWLLQHPAPREPSGLREQGLTGKLRHTSDGSSSTGGEDVSDLDLLDEVSLDPSTLDSGLEDSCRQHVSSRPPKTPRKHADAPTRRSSGQVSLKGPLRARVMAVRTAETITTSLSFCLRMAARPWEAASSWEAMAETRVWAL